MTEIFEEQMLHQYAAPELFEPPTPPKQPAASKQSFSDAMANLAERSSLASFVERKDLPGYKNLTAGIGLNLPLPSDSTKVTIGVEGRASVFSTPRGTQMTKGIVPSLRVTQDLGKNAKLMARLSPSPSDYASIGVQFNI